MKISWLCSFLWSGWFWLVIKLFIFIGPFTFSVSFLVHFGNLHFLRHLPISLIKFDGINLLINLFTCVVVFLFISDIVYAFSLILIILTSLFYLSFPRASFCSTFQCCYFSALNFCLYVHYFFLLYYSLYSYSVSGFFFY